MPNLQVRTVGGDKTDLFLVIEKINQTLLTRADFPPGRSRVV